MKIIQFHNEYKLSGGEDTVVENERLQLEANGHEVIQHKRHNRDLEDPWVLLSTLWSLKYSSKSYEAVSAVLQRTKPDVAHVHNYFPQYTPAVFDACYENGIPVVHTLHNFRIICPSATFYIGGRIDESSLVKGPYSVVKKRAYRDSYVLTLLVAGMIDYHKNRGTWKTKVDRFLALSEFARDKFIEFGLPPNKVIVKPNFVFDSPDGGNDLNSRIPQDRKYAIYVGRLSEEKGVKVLLDAWEHLDEKLVVCGAGPLDGLVSDAASRLNIDYLGQLDREEVYALIRNADLLIVPSLWYEGLPMVLLEALSMGVPVVVSNIGTLGEVVNEKIGYRVPPGDKVALRSTVLEHLSSDSQAKSEGARKEFQDRYSVGSTYHKLMEAYDAAISEAQSR